MKRRRVGPQFIQALLDLEPVSVPDEADRPFEFLLGVREPYDQLDPICILSLPGQVKHATPSENRFPEVAGPHGLTQEAEGVKYGALARRVGANEQIEVVQMDFLAPETAVMIRT